jgi:hypothetical protein
MRLKGLERLTDLLSTVPDTALMALIKVGGLVNEFPLPRGIFLFGLVQG